MVAVLSVFVLACAVTAAGSDSLGLIDLPPVTDPNGQSSSSTTTKGVGWAINASGQVAGYASISTGGINPYSSRAFVYSGGAMTDLNVGGVDGAASPTGKAFGINDSGTVVGQAFTSAANGMRTFVTSGGTMTDLDAYNPTISQSIAYGVTSSGTTVVGAGTYGGTAPWQPFVYSYSGNYNPATGVYSGGTWSYTDINSVLGTTGGRGMALAVNNAGTATGYATYAISNDHTYVQAFAGTSSGGVHRPGLAPRHGLEHRQRHQRQRGRGGHGFPCRLCRLRKRLWPSRQRHPRLSRSRRPRRLHDERLGRADRLRH